MNLATRLLLPSLLAAVCSSTEVQLKAPAHAQLPAAKELERRRAIPAWARAAADWHGAAATSLDVDTDSDVALIAELTRLSDTDNRVQDHLRHLGLAIGPRLTSSHTLAKAERWAQEQIRSGDKDEGQRARRSAARKAKPAAEQKKLW